MLETSDLQQIDKAFPRLRVIWIVMLVSLGAYVLLANLLGPVLGFMPMFSEPADPATAKYGYGLYGIAAAELIVAYFFRRGLIAQKGSKSQIGERLDSFFGSSATAQGPLGINEAIGLYRGGTILSLGLCEAVALCGLMGFIVRTDYIQLYILTALSLAALVHMRPKKQEMIAVVDKAMEESEQRRKSPKY